MTEQHKLIYNLYLKNLAIKNNRPYKPRVDFSNISKDTEVAIIKLGLFFERNPEINIDWYFKAGFQATTSTFLKIENFHNIAMIKCYSKFIKQYYNNSVDSPEVIDDFVEGLKFIISFLKENGITLRDYPRATNEHGIPYILIHLKKQQISLYHFHCFNVSFSDINLGDEILNMYLDDFKTKFFETKTQYTRSNKLKTIGDKITSKINQ